MAIQDQLRQLYELSQLDFQIDQIRNKIAHLPERRAELQQLIETKRHEVAANQSKLETLEKEKREIEGELQLSSARLKDFQEKVNQIKTNKEYQAALKEIAETKQSNKEMEDRILKLMTETEAVQKAIQADAGAGHAELAAAEREMSELGDQEKLIEDEVKGFEERRAELMAGLEAGLVSQYERIKRFRSDAVTLVTNGTCQGCHMNIPPQLFIEIQKFHSIHSCPSCRRILYLTGGSS